MNFGQNIIATLIGTIAGFAFSIVLYYLTHKWNISLQKKNLKGNLKKEFDFNLNFLKILLSDINKVIERITANNTKVYTYFKYINFQRIFLQSYFQQGHLYESLSNEEIQLLDEILSHFDKPFQDYINFQIEEWKKGNILQSDILDIFAFERETITKYIEQLTRVSKKIIN